MLKDACCVCFCFYKGWGLLLPLENYLNAFLTKLKVENYPKNDKLISDFKTTFTCSRHTYRERETMLDCRQQSESNQSDCMLIIQVQLSPDTT